MDINEIPPSPILTTNLHPTISNTQPEAGPLRIERQLQTKSTAECQSLNILRRNLTPYLPVVLSRTSLLRAQLAQLIMERDFTKGHLDEAVTHIAELDRYLKGLRAFQLIRQEGLRDEAPAM